MPCLLNTFPSKYLSINFMSENFPCSLISNSADMYVLQIILAYSGL